MFRIKPPIGDLLTINDWNFPDLLVGIMDDIVRDIGSRHRIDSRAVKMDATQFSIDFDPLYLVREPDGKLPSVQLNDAANIKENASEFLKSRWQSCQVVAGIALPAIR